MLQVFSNLAQTQRSNSSFARKGTNILHSNLGTPEFHLLLDFCNLLLCYLTTNFWAADEGTASLIIHFSRVLVKKRNNLE